MSSHKNLLAAKSALGLAPAANDDDGAQGLRSSVTSRGSGSTHRSSSASRASAARSTSASRAEKSTSASRMGERSTAGTATSARSNSTGRSKRSFIHDLSTSARREARGYGEGDAAAIWDPLDRRRGRQTSSTAEERSRIEERRMARMDSGNSAASGAAGTLGGSSNAGTLATGYSSARQPRSTLSGYGSSQSRVPSMAPSHPSARTNTMTMHESIDGTTVNEEGSEMDSLTAPPHMASGSTIASQAHASSFDGSNRSGHSSHIGTVDSRVSGDTAATARTSRSRFLETKSSIGSATVDANSFGHSFGASFGNAFEQKMSPGTVEDGSNSIASGTSGANSLTGDWPPSRPTGGTTRQMQQIEEHSQLQLQQPTEEFVPQRFDEMRALLSAITPLQLEALMMEIFQGAGPPQGWHVPKKKKGKKKAGYRKDAYLSEMSLAELRRFAEGKNMPAIAACDDCDEALDIIAIEFERLVSRHQNGNDDMGASMAPSESASEAVSFVSGSTTTSAIADEGANLRHSLRACSLPELRLVAERLHLDHSECQSKEDLISMIEQIMPDVGGSPGGEVSVDDSQFAGSEYSLPQTTASAQYSQTQSELHQSLDTSQPIDDSWRTEDSRRRVQFAANCKEDRSHLIPKREKGGSWQSFVVAAEGTPDVEYGGEDVDTARPLVHSLDRMEEQALREGGRKRRRRRRPTDEDYPGGRVQLPQFMERIKLPEQFPEMPFHGKGKRVLGFLVLLAIVIGLSVGLTKDDSGGDADVLLPDPNDPFFTGDFRNPFAPATTEMPSARPTAEPTVGEEESASPTLGKDESPGPTVENEGSPGPTTEGSLSSPSTASSSGLASFSFLSESGLDDGGSPSPSSHVTFVHRATAPPSSDVEGESATTDSPTPRPVERPLTQSPIPGWFQQKPGTVTTPPTPLSYPVKGPFDETGLRLILYGVGELTNMGKTQFKMLTAAYVEQFFNKEGVGDDAIQNIVFDVICGVEIERQALLGGRREERSLRDRASDQRQLQEGVVMTFTMTVSYRTFSSFIEADTVAERPFFDEEIRAGYVQYMIDSNAASHIGDISAVSPIFRGDDIPEAPEGMVGTEMSPTRSPLFQIADVPAPEPTTDRPTDRPVSPAPVEAEVTPQPTDQPVTPAPVEKMTPSPSPKPTAGAPKPESYYPTPSALLSSEPPTYSGDVRDITPATAANVVSPEPTDSPIRKPTPNRPLPPTHAPSSAPTKEPSSSPTSAAPTEYCKAPVNEPICPLLAEHECCSPTCKWDSAAGLCSFLDSAANREVEWLGEFEAAQTHVVKAQGETRHAPRIIADREVELLFTPGVARRLDEPTSSSAQSQRIESLGTAYLLREGGNPVLDASAQQLLDGSGTVFSLPNDIPEIGIVVDLNSLRIVEGVSLLLHGDTALTGARIGLHYDDGRNEEEGEGFHMPESDWAWFDLESSTAGGLEGEISVAIPGAPARYVMLSMEGGNAQTSNSWGFGSIEIRGSADGLPSNPTSQSIQPVVASRTFVPPNTAMVRVAVYSRQGELIGSMKARDPTQQRGILERQLSLLEIPDYSDDVWSATLPFNWVAEGNYVVIGCVDDGRPDELLANRLELVNLAQFSEHTITRTKLAIFGSQSDLASLDSSTHPARRLARDLYSVMSVAELKWADTDVWHLPYVVVMGTDGPVLVNSEEERRNATGDGEGSEISWQVMKNFLTVRHSLANTGHGFSATSEDGANSPYASGTSVFMGWSLSKQNAAGRWEWEDLGYWDDLAAAAWTGWCAMRAGDECSNYFVHEIGHAQTMQHFDAGMAAKWGIEDEYPQDGKHMAHHPWGYDAASRQFRTWFDPFQGDGKLDPLNGAGEGPTSEQCFSQYTPYQAKKSQEWAQATPILLSASSSGVPRDGAYKFHAPTRQYSLLERSSLSDAVGDAAMEPDQVGVPVATLVGTIGKDPGVCQTYPALRSRAGNVFQFPDPFSSGLPLAYNGAAHYVEVKFADQSTLRGLIAAGNDLGGTALKFFSFNVPLDRRPASVALYRFTESAYPDLDESNAELLHLRPIDLPTTDPLLGLPPLARVGRGWLGHSSDVVIDRFCETSDDCNSDRYSIEWRGTDSSDNVVYSSSLDPEPQQVLGATVLKMPVVREFDSEEYTVTLLATRFFNGGLGASPLLTTSPSSVDGSLDTDATHGIRLIAPWEMNDSLPPGFYHSVPDALVISASGAAGGNQLLSLNVSLNLGTVTEAPTRSPTKKPSPGPTQSPVEIRWYVDWLDFTCRTDGEGTEWAAAHLTKQDCCFQHIAYDFAGCMGKE
ncbi:hypothetical protein ACHAXT_006174 [Thalassiosira profunda]